MTIQHHPSDETLLHFAAGQLSAAVRFVIATHIEGCDKCTRDVGRFQAVGGCELDQLEATGLTDSCFTNTMARIDRSVDDERAALTQAILASPRRADGIVLPRALDGCDIGPWRWLGPGIRLSRIHVPKAPDSNLMLLRVAANQLLPEHGHTGTEYTQVLTGSLLDGKVKLLPGDIMEADHDLQHQPMAGPDCDCLCLAAIDGKLKIGGFIGRTILNVYGL